MNSKDSNLTVFAGPGFVDDYGSPVELFAVQFVYSLLGLFFGGHLHETEPFAAARFAIGYYVGGYDIARFGKEILKAVVCGGPCQGAYE